jgi:hypothetical protein
MADPTAHQHNQADIIDLDARLLALEADDSTHTSDIADLLERVAALEAGGGPAPPPPPPGPQLYVATTGNDTNDGSSAAPVATFGRAQTLATPGFTINVAPGVYPAFTFSKSGDATTGRIKWKSTTKWGARLTASSGTSGNTVTASAQYVDIEDFEITQGRLGVAVTNSNVAIRGNLVHDVCRSDTPSSGGAGIDVYTGTYTPLDNVVVERNVVYDVGLNVAAAQTVQGIYVAIPCQGGVIANNIVYGVQDYGIHCYHNPRYWKIVNNVIFGTGRGLLGCPDGIVANNIIKNIGATGTGGTGTAVATNTDGGAAPVWRNNLQHNASGTRTGVTVADPLFTTTPATKTTAFSTSFFRLGSTSPGKNAGSTGDAPAVDFEGTTRPQGTAPDIGAYEAA